MLGWAGLTGRDGDEIKFQSPLISKCQAGWNRTWKHCYFRRITLGQRKVERWREEGLSSGAKKLKRPRRFPRSFGRLGAEYKSKFPLGSSSHRASEARGASKRERVEQGLESKGKGGGEGN